MSHTVEFNFIGPIATHTVEPLVSELSSFEFCNAIEKAEKYRNSSATSDRIDPNRRQYITF